MVYICVATLSWAADSAENKYKGFERGGSLITATELKKLIDTRDSDLVILAVTKAMSYRMGHIPGAHQVWRSDYAAAVNKPYPFGGMILNRTDFERFARKYGINNNSKIIIYDHNLDATRLWWAFYLYGKTDVRVLDGGYQAWKKAGYNVGVLAPSSPGPGNFKAASPLPGWTASMDDVWLSKSESEYQLWDTRERNEWTGGKLMRGAFRKGRVPWAVFLNWKEFKQPVVEGGALTEFKTAAEIQKLIEEYEIDKDKHHIFYCQAGLRTTTNIFALYLLGWDPARLHNYDGSWIQWSYFDKNPIVTGK